MLTQRVRRIFGFAATVALGAALFAPTVAHADPDNALVDPAKDGQAQLVIHKHKQTEDNGTTPGNGLEETVDSEAVADVTFQIQRLNYDLTTAQGWKDLAALNGSVTAAEAQVDGSFAPQEKVTGADGIADFSNLPLGAYIVKETKTPANVTPAEDFIVTVPMTHPVELDKWLYAVHVYPKNPILGGNEKTVDDSAAHSVGDPLVYTIKADIPKLDVAGGATLKNYKIVDPLHSRLTYEADKTEVTMTGAGAVPLEASDYTVTTATQTIDGDEKTVVTVDFTEAGRAKIAAARANGGDATTKVQVVLHTTVKEIGSSSDVIENTSYLIPNGDPNTPWDPENNPGVPGATVESKFGTVNITKTGTDNSADPSVYQGAEFQVFRCSVPAGTKTGDVVDATLVGDAMPAKQVHGGTPSTDPVTTFVTDAQGKVSIDALRANDWRNGAEVPSADLTGDDWYCLKETKAPVGYQLQAKPIAFQVLHGTVDADSGKIALDMTVTDVPENAGFKLPLTGAAGVVVLIGAGILLIVGAGALAVVNRRRRRDNS